jgi:PAB1-binding protein PBP1
MLDAPPSYDLWNLAVTALVSAAGGGGIATLIQTYLNRKKPAAEVEVAEASADESRERSNTLAFKTSMDIIAQIRQELERAEKRHATDCESYELQIKGLRQQNEGLSGEAESLKQQNKLLREMKGVSE